MEIDKYFGMYLFLKFPNFLLYIWAFVCSNSEVEVGDSLVGLLEQMNLGNFVVLFR